MNCKPGDLAYIVNDGGSGGLGFVVEVLRRSDRPNGTPAWIVRLGEGLVATHRETGLECGDEVRIPDAWLRPIGGVPVTDDVTDEVRA